MIISGLARRRAARSGMFHRLILTIELDGTVICAGAMVAWAARGYHPHHRKVASYYPLLAHLAQTGQVLRLKNGPGNYSAVATNLTLTLRALWYFAAGRGAQEKTIAELKGEFALDAVPTNHYGANSAWLQLCVLAHNLIRSFQLHLNLATPKPQSRKRTYRYLIASMKTLRFLVINRAARLARISGRKVLRFSSNPATESLYGRILNRLAA
jgi:hypothetical protein